MKHMDVSRGMPHARCRHGKSTWGLRMTSCVGKKLQVMLKSSENATRYEDALVEILSQFAHASHAHSTFSYDLGQLLESWPPRQQGPVTLQSDVIDSAFTQEALA